MKVKKTMRRLFEATAAALLCAAFTGVSAPVAAQQLRQTQFEDGTGSIGLPPGWRITQAYRGSVVCVGPNGEGVILGRSWFVIPVGTALPGTSPNQPTARPGDIVGAWREVLFKNLGGARLTGLQGRPAPSAVPGAPAAHLLFNFAEPGGRSTTGFGYFSSMYQPGNAIIQLYSSYFVAPSDRFNQTAQLMTSMWRSWRPNGQEPLEGSSSAMWDRILRERQITFDFWTRLMREQL